MCVKIKFETPLKKKKKKKKKKNLEIETVSIFPHHTLQLLLLLLQCLLNQSASVARPRFPWPTPAQPIRPQ
jgi:hypothetical protein